MLFAPGIIEAVVGMSVAGLGFGLVGALYRSLHTGWAPAHLRGGLVSLGEAGARLPITLTPLLMGGVIAVASPSFGLASSLRLAGVAIAVLGGGCGLAYLLAGRAARPVSMMDQGHVNL